MARQLAIVKGEDGVPAVNCPRCAEVVSPARNPLFDGYDCPECEQVIQGDQLAAYRKALRAFDDGEFEDNGEESHDR